MTNVPGQVSTESYIVLLSTASKLKNLLSPLVVTQKRNHAGKTNLFKPNCRCEDGGGDLKEAGLRALAEEK